MINMTKRIKLIINNIFDALGIRRFIKQLEDDGRVYEVYKRNMYMMQGPSAMDNNQDISSEDSGGCLAKLRI